MSVFITGDCHGNFDKVFNFAEKMQLTIDDTIIVLGDMGLCWRKDKKDYNYYTKIWEEFEYKCNLLWIEGNHENYNIIETLPIENNMRKCSEYIHMLIRGQVYNIANHNCLIIGGADSVDKYIRTPNLNWWKQEQITNENIITALNNVKDLSIDYIFTHSAPTSIVNKYKSILCELVLDDEVLDHTSENNLEIIKQKVNFKKWYFGHFHQDVHLNEKFQCLYNSFDEVL